MFNVSCGMESSNTLVEAADEPMGRCAAMGFVFGAAFPFVTIMGLVIPYLEYLKPLVVGRHVAMALFAKQPSQTLAWVVTAAANGIFYAIGFAVIHRIAQQVRGKRPS